MSKTRSSSANSLPSSWKSADRHSSGCRVGASRLPSRVVIAGASPVKYGCRKHGHAEARLSPRLLRARPFKFRSVGQLVQGLLEAVRVRALGFGQRLEPIGDFRESFGAVGLLHSLIHFLVF